MTTDSVVFDQTTVYISVDILLPKVAPLDPGGDQKESPINSEKFQNKGSVRFVQIMLEISVVSHDVYLILDQKTIHHPSL